MSNEDIVISTHRAFSVVSSNDNIVRLLFLLVFLSLTKFVFYF